MVKEKTPKCYEARMGLDDEYIVDIVPRMDDRPPYGLTVAQPDPERRAWDAEVAGLNPACQTILIRTRRLRTKR